MPPRKNQIAAKIVSFLDEIGIRLEFGVVGDDTFLPGIDVVDGGLLVEESKLRYPGDLLHEAGHLAVSPPDARDKFQGTIEITHAIPPVVEAAAMSWSYAACLHLGIDPRVVFHDDGYHGQSEALLRTFSLGLFPGISELESAGMTFSVGAAARLGKEPFPVMVKWIRGEDRP